MKYTTLYKTAIIVALVMLAFGCEFFLEDQGPPPAAPSGLTVAVLSSGQIELSWTDNSEDEEWFVIERSDDLAEIFATRASSPSNITIFVDADLEIATTYHYRVYAGNKGGNSIASNIVNATSLASPISPSDLVGVTISDSQIDLTWVDNSINEDGFEIQRSDDGGSTYISVGIVGVGVVEFTDSGLLPNTEFTYRVLAYNTAATSQPSNAEIATTFIASPSAPDGLTAVATASDRITLNWNDNATNESNYRVLRSDNGGEHYSIISTLPSDTETFTDYGLSSNEEYFYTVYALSAFGSSQTSTSVSATTLSFSGRFVAVGANGLVTYSDDGGSDWTIVSDTDLTSHFFRDVAYDPVNERIVVVGDNGYAVYSDDGGVSWAVTIISTTEDLYTIEWGAYSGSVDAGRFVATGTGSDLFYSDTADTESWTDVVTVHAIYYGVAFGADIYAFVASNYSAIRSTDGGNTFENNVNSGIYGHALVYATTRFISVGRDGSDNSEGFNYSTDGVGWTSVNPANVVVGALESIEFNGNNTVVAVGWEAAGNTGRMWNTTNEGNTWGLASGPLPDAKCYGVAYGEGVWISVGEIGTGNVWLSTDTDNWIAINAGAERLNEVIYLP
jgi:hypothetical protein